MVMAAIGDGETRFHRYLLHSFAVMPNHVHALIAPRDEFELEQILHSWKSYTGLEINRIVGRRGRLWEPEYFDHIVRNSASFDRILSYIATNPAQAGLTDWPWIYIAEAVDAP